MAAFRGTNDWKNWVEDADFGTTNYPHGNGAQVHDGFYIDYQGT